MHCEKCGSADTEVVKCGDCGQKSRVRCANCGFSTCTDKYCSVIAIKRKIRILTWCAGMIFLIMLGTMPFVIRTYLDKGKPTTTPTPTATATTAATPTARPTVPPTKPATPTAAPTIEATSAPTVAPTPTKAPTTTPTTAPTPKPGEFPNQAAFEEAMVSAIDAGKGALFGKGSEPSSMNPHQYIRWTFGRVGWDVPAKIDQLKGKGLEVKKAEDLRPGDIVFFSMKMDGKPSYMGLYRGSGKFACIIPKDGKGWIVGPLSHKFFQPRFLYGRRYWPRPAF